MEIHSIEAKMRAMQLLFGMVTNFTGTDQFYPEQADLSDGESFDFIIVGGGSAGSVLANRLTEIRDWNVLLIEAGDYPTITSDIPGYFTLLKSSPADWNYKAWYEFENITRLLHEPRGKLLGGSSSTNWMFYVRGNKADYDSWAEAGNEGWNFDSVLPYFRKIEHLHDDQILESSSSELRGTDGFLHITRPVSQETDVYFEALNEMGHNVLEDFNGREQLGFSRPQFNIYKGTRQSTAVAYIRPIKSRRNLHVLTKSFVTKVILDDNNQAIGVKVQLPDEQSIELFASKEVIISAGAINSPQLLMLSGIGPKAHLEEMNVPVLVDSPNVGQNLQDHVVAVFGLSGQTGADFTKDDEEYFVEVFQFPGPTVIGHVALDKTQTYPDYQAYLFPFSTGALLPTVLCSYFFKLGDEACGTIEQARRQELIFANVCALHPKSRGSVKLITNKPEDHPAIDLGFFSDTDDLDRMVLYIEDFIAVLETGYFQSMNSTVLALNVSQCQHLEFRSEEFWRCYVVYTAGTQYHVAGTCAMGPEGQGVVDARLSVHGVQSLRVVDASVMPTIVSGNTNAAVMMIAEKAADMIKQDWDS